MTIGRRLSVLTSGVFVAAAILLAGTGGTAQAASGTWNTLVNGALWNTGGNWLGGTPADGQTFTAYFDALDLLADTTASVDVNTLTIGNITFGDTPTPSHNWILDDNASGGGNKLQFSVNTDTRTITVTNGITATMSVGMNSTAVANGNKISKLGNGTLVLSGQNTLCGDVNATLSASASVDGGELRITGSVKASTMTANTGRAQGEWSVGATTAGSKLTIIGYGSPLGYGAFGGGLRIGGGAAGNNVVTYTGPGSSVNYQHQLRGNGASLYLGFSSSGNTLTVNNGGYVWHSGGSGTVNHQIGVASGADNNAMTITGESGGVASTLRAGGMVVGVEGNQNSLTVSAGGCVTNAALRVGLGGVSGNGDNNWVLVTGGGTAASRIDIANSGNAALELGGANGANGNSVRIAAGGRIVMHGGSNNGRALSIGRVAGADNNYVEITGTNSYWNVTYPVRPITIGGDQTGAGPVGTSIDGGSGNYVWIKNGGDLTANTSLYVYGDLALVSANYLKIGSGVGDALSTARFGQATAYTPGIYLKNPSGRLVFDNGKLTAGADLALVSGAGQISLNGPAYISTTQPANTITTQIRGTGSLTKEGTGKLTLTTATANDYGGGTTVSAGTLVFSGAGGAESLPTTGTVTVSPGATLSRADVAVNSATVGTLTLNGTGTPATLRLDALAGGVDAIASTGAATVSGDIVLDLGSVTAPANTYTVLTALSGLDVGSFTTIPPYTVIQSATSVQVQLFTVAYLPTAYWLGQTDFKMNAANWSSTENPATPSGDLVNNTSDVFFSANGATGQGSVVVGGNLTIKSLTFNDPTPVTINAGGTLTVNQGLTASNSATINCSLALAASPDATVTVDTGATLTLGGTLVLGASNLAKAGAGTLRVTGANTLAGSTKITAGALSVEGGVTLQNLTTLIGDAAADDNQQLTVTGTGSTLTFGSGSAYLYAGNAGAGNTVTVSAGGKITTTQAAGALHAYIGYAGGAGGADNNAVVVTGTNSVFEKPNTLYVGYSGDGNSLSISGGGSVSCFFGRIGDQAGSDNNAVTITGSGSTWTVTGGSDKTVYVGNGGGTGNHLDINNGGRLTKCTQLWLIGPSSAVNLGNGTGIGEIEISGMFSDGIRMNHATSQFNFNSGRIKIVDGNQNFFASGYPGAVTLNGLAYFDSNGYSGSANLAMGGGGSLIKESAGTLTLTAANTYSGGTIVSNGTLRVGSAVGVIPDGPGKGDVSNAVAGAVLDLNTYSETINGLWGIGSVDTVAGGTPTLTVGNGGASSTFGGVIKNTAGTLGLTKIGTGTVTLAGANTYGGQTTVSNGTLALVGGGSINNTPLIQLAAGTAVLDVSAVAPFHVLNGRELKGTGQVTGNTVMDSGSKLTPGNSIGKLTWVGNLTLSTGTTNYFELGNDTTGGVTYDQVGVNGTLTATGVKWSDFNFTTNASFGAGTYTLFAGGSPAVGPLGTPADGMMGTLLGTLSLSGNDLRLTVAGPVTTVIKFK